MSLLLNGLNLEDHDRIQLPIWGTDCSHLRTYTCRQNGLIRLSFKTISFTPLINAIRYLKWLLGVTGDNLDKHKMGRFHLLCYIIYYFANIKLNRLFLFSLSVFQSSNKTFKNITSHTAFYSDYTIYYTTHSVYTFIASHACYIYVC